VHHGSVLTGYGITPELPFGDWASTSLHLIRIDDEAADGTGPLG
jgi:alpha-galactosidase